MSDDARFRRGFLLALVVGITAAFIFVVKDFLMTIGSARPLEDAARIAYRELVRWMSADYGFDEIDAYMLLSQAGRIRLGNMVDPKYTMGASILKKYLIS